MSEERQTASGIALPEPEGHAICILSTDVPQLQINIVIPEGDDRLAFVEQLAEKVARKQRNLDLADVDSYQPLQMADPHFGDPFYLTPHGARHIIGVGHGRATKVDPTAAANHRRLLDGVPRGGLPVPRGPLRIQRRGL